VTASDLGSGGGTLRRASAVNALGAASADAFADLRGEFLSVAALEFGAAALVERCTGGFAHALPVSSPTRFAILALSEASLEGRVARVESFLCRERWSVAVSAAAPAMLRGEGRTWRVWAATLSASSARILVAVRRGRWATTRRSRRLLVVLGLHFAGGGPRRRRRQAALQRGTAAQSIRTVRLQTGLEIGETRVRLHLEIPVVVLCFGEGLIRALARVVT
jgi:hypothetical protein